MRTVRLVQTRAKRSRFKDDQPRTETRAADPNKANQACWLGIAGGRSAGAAIGNTAIGPRCLTRRRSHGSIAHSAPEDLPPAITTGIPIPHSSGCGFGREVAVLVDKELAVVKPANSPVLEPLLGDLLQNPVLLLPHHEMPSALDGESQLVVVLD